MAALERGVAVFCQKPLGRDASEVRAAVAAAEAADFLLGVDLSYRRTAATKGIADRLRAGALGSLFAADLTFHNAAGRLGRAGRGRLGSAVGDEPRVRSSALADGQGR